MPEDYTDASNAQIAHDQVELCRLEQLLYQLPDGLILSDSDERAAQGLRIGISSALQAMREILDEIRMHPVGVTRAKLIAPLSRWRVQRARYAQLVALRKPIEVACGVGGAGTGRPPR